MGRSAGRGFSHSRQCSAIFDSRLGEGISEFVGSMAGSVVVAPTLKFSDGSGIPSGCCSIARTVPEVSADSDLRLLSVNPPD